ncbi:MAG: hypothetical protein GY857_13430 [Desulfobacula sp.]|nr:hypothetical protein [Desulfobacula sp.]
MPKMFQKYLLYILPMAPVILLMVFIHATPVICADEGIETFYIRYDVKSSKNRIVDAALLMIPAKNEFRAEKFSQITTTGVISAHPAGNGVINDKKIREDALKTILVKNGLQSIKTKDMDTVISYEGVIITPVNILKNIYNKDGDNYSYEVRLEFSPIAFPDKWETLDMKHKIKETIYEFFDLFNL